MSVFIVKKKKITKSQKAISSKCPFFKHHGGKSQTKMLTWLQLLDHNYDTKRNSNRCFQKYDHVIPNFSVKKQMIKTNDLL